jgi:hypothetical protein
MNFRSLDILKRMFKNFPKETKLMILDLYNEQINISDRIKQFKFKAEELAQKLNAGLKSSQDERSISLYLTFRYPDKYIHYKPSYYNVFIKYLSVEKAKPGYKFEHFQELAQDFKQKYILPDTELLKLVDEFTNEKCYPDTSRNILTQDVIFFLEFIEKGNNINEQETLFKKVLKTFTIDDLNFFYDTVDKVISGLNISKGSKEISFTVNETGELKVIIGKRAILSLMRKENGSIYNFISKDKLSNDSYEFSQPKDAYYNETNLKEIVQSHLDEIISCSKDELSRTTKSNYIKNNNPFFEKSVFDKEYRKNLIAIDEINEMNEIDKESKVNKIMMPLNQILYGPPGTGKTFKLENEYFEKFIEEKRITKEEYINELVSELSWWETVAIVLYDLNKAKVPDLLKHELLHAKIQNSDSKRPGSTVWFYLQQHTAPNTDTVQVKKRKEPYIFNKSADSVWSINKDEFEQACPDLLAIYQKYKTNEEVTDKKKNYDFVTFHQSFTYEDFIEGIKPVLNDTDNEDTKGIEYEITDGVFKKIALEAQKNPKSNYCIFIDEINRGNIAKIFGELITLIEPDKREKLKVILPYSKKEFSIPKNLYIIGTMNTADRSIALLDTALRRRFEFVEVMPDPALLNDIVIKGIRLKELLEKINERIEFLYDRDHVIGHSYFLKVESFEDLCNVFRNKIIPLLQEYFYNDWEKVQLVLGDNKEWGKSDDQKLIVVAKKYSGSDEKELFGVDLDDYEDITRYEVNQSLKDQEYYQIPPEAFIHIYKKPSKGNDE